MKPLIMVLLAIIIANVSIQCKKNENKKLENPFGLLLLGSDTTLPDGRYVIRTKNGCSGFANTLRCEDADEVMDMNGTLYPIDHISLLTVDTQMVCNVKKVRYVSPDPDYALAFGYRIYQYRPSGNGPQYRFLSFTAFANVSRWTDDQVGDGGGKSVKARTGQMDKYPNDPPVPIGFGTDTSSTPHENTYFIFQFYESKDNPGYLRIKAGGVRASTANQPSDRWKFCTAYWKESDCDGSVLPPHFRSEYSGCEHVDDGNVSQRCYIDEFFFQKVY